MTPEFRSAFQKIFIANYRAFLLRTYGTLPPDFEAMATAQAEGAIAFGLTKSEIVQVNLQLAIDEAIAKFGGPPAHEIDYQGDMSALKVQPTVEQCEALTDTAPIVLNFTGGRGGYVRAADRLAAAAQRNGRKLIFVAHSDITSADTNVMIAADWVICRPDIRLRFHAIRRPEDEKNFRLPKSSPEDTLNAFDLWKKIFETGFNGGPLDYLDEIDRKALVEKAISRLGPDWRDFMEAFSTKLFQKDWANFTAAQGVALGLADVVVPDALVDVEH